MRNFHLTLPLSLPSIKHTYSFQCQIKYTQFVPPLTQLGPLQSAGESSGKETT